MGQQGPRSALRGPACRVPAAKRISPANLQYMRRFAEAWPDNDAVGHRPINQLPWGHFIEPPEKLVDGELQ